MLNSVEWKYFKLKDLFEISLGKHKKKEDLSLKSIKTHNIPYITSSSMNNGVDGYSSESNAKNVITIGTRGSNFAFYHKSHIFASSNVAILRLKNSLIKINKYKALFITVIINNEQYRWSYGFNPTLTRLKKIEIKLPVDSKGDPNWKFMEEYMRKISRGNLDGFNVPKNDVRLSLYDREWDEFKLEDLFEIERGKRLIKKDRIAGDIPYMSASEINNGITDKISNPLFIRTNSLCLTTFGDAFYYKKEFTASDEVTILSNNQLNSYVGLFMVNILQHQKYRYSFGRKLYYNKIKYISIKLPIKPKSSPDEKSEPDWKFMENYIKGLPYTNKL